MPAGSSHISAGGYQPGGDAKLHADLLLRHDGAADQMIIATDSTIPQGNDAGAPGGIEADLPSPAVDSVCGDLLVLRVKMLSGSHKLSELGVGLVVP